MRVSLTCFIFITGLVVVTVIVYWHSLAEYLKIDPTMFKLFEASSKQSETEEIPHGNMITNSQRQTEQPSSILNVSRKIFYNLNNTRIITTDIEISSQHSTSRNMYNISTTPLALASPGEGHILSTRLEISSKKPVTIHNTTTAFKTSSGSNSDNKHNATLYVSAADLTNGRLGNQMFKYASLLGIARSQNRTLAVPSRSDLQKTFKLNYVADMPESSKWPVFSEASAYVFDIRLMNLTKQNVSINGFLQSYKYFQDYADEVRQEFLFTDSIANEANLIVHNLVSQRKGTLFVGVHVRRGDFLSQRNQKLGYGVPEKSYFLKAFNWMQSKFPNRNITYLVASDDSKWCNETLSSDNVLSLPDANPVIHLAILSSCDHVIMSGGTYGWWASFLAGGYVIYFKRFMAKGTAIGDTFTPEVYYPPLWIAMDN